MNALVLVSGAVLAMAGETTMTGQEAPGFIVADWVAGPEVSLRNIQGRKMLVFLYHTAC